MKKQFTPHRGLIEQLVNLAQRDGVLAIHGLQKALLDAAIALSAASERGTLTEPERLAKKWLSASPVVSIRVDSAGALLWDALHPTAASVPSAIPRIAPNLKVKVRGPKDAECNYDLYMGETYLGQYHLDLITPLANAIGKATGEYK